MTHEVFKGVGHRLHLTVLVRMLSLHADERPAHTCTTADCPSGDAVELRSFSYPNCGSTFPCGVLLLVSIKTDYHLSLYVLCHMTLTG